MTNLPFAQSYAALGLAHSLSPCDSGGREVEAGGEGSARHESAGSSRGGEEGSGGGSGGIGEEQGSAGGIPRGFGKIVRDESGKVVRVELGEEGGETEEGRGHVVLAKNGTGQPGRMTAGSEWVFLPCRESKVIEGNVLHGG